MKFLPELRRFLRDHGTIYTVRGYDMKPAWVWVDGVGHCWRQPLGGIHNMEDLRSYVHLSGFDDVESWWSKIEEFCRGGDMWLYRVGAR